MNLTDLHTRQGAALAPDGIPLHYADRRAEYHAALERAVLMDRSHEGRLELLGRDRFELAQRLSTNNVLDIAPNEGRPTIFTNPNGRILDRVTLYRRGETALLLAEPGRGEPVRQYIQRNIFFNDQVSVNDLAPATRLFALHGPAADAVLDDLSPGASQLPGLAARDLSVAGIPVIAARRKPLNGAFWSLLVPAEQAAPVWQAAQSAGERHGLALAGSLTYNVLRIRAGRPGVGRELSLDYIPLEAGLWDEVNFHKGCYTGQEIIARMESRSRLAKTLVMLALDAPVEAPAPLAESGKPAGTLTSSVTTPDGEHIGLGFVKVALAAPGQTLTAGDASIAARITALAGAQPPALS